MKTIEKQFKIAYNKLSRAKNLQASFREIENSEQLILFLTRYISFNSVFAGGVSRLAGAIHNSQDKFSSKKFGANMNIYSKSSEIASYVFAAAEDEYNARRRNERITHREMARFFLDSVKEFYAEENFKVLNIDTHLQKHINEALKGYCANGNVTTKKIFNGIGFHIASEELADQEFIELDKFLSVTFPKLVSFLKEKKHNFGLSAYYWVKSHCTVEKEHHDFALKALDIAITNYSGNHSEKEIENFAINGFLQFCNLQDKLIEHSVNFTFDVNQDALENYIEKTLKPPNKVFENISPCPYIGRISKEKLDNKIIYNSYNFSKPIDSNLTSFIKTNLKKSHILLVYDTNSTLELLEFRDYGKKICELLKEETIITIALHPQDTFKIKDFYTRRVPFHTLLIQYRKIINEEREKLKKTDYYKNWTKDDLQINEDQFGKFL